MSQQKGKAAASSSRDNGRVRDSNAANDDGNAAGPSSSNLNQFADRRQQRMRGAGKHEITSRKNLNFDDLNSSPSTINGAGYTCRSSIATLLSSSASRANPRGSIPSTPLFFGTRKEDVSSSSSPAMSIRSGRGAASSPSKYIDPRLLGDNTHQDYLGMIDERARYDHNSSPIVNGGMLIGKTIDERRQERMRGAGVHQVESRPVRFSMGDSTRDGSSSEVRQTPRSNKDHHHQHSQNGTPWKSPAGSLDRFMHSIANRGTYMADLDNDDGSTHPGVESDWINQRRVERRRGAGIHAIEQRKISFAPRGTDGSTTASSIADYNEEERIETNWIDQRRAERRRGAGNHAIEQRKISFEPRATDGSMTSSSIADQEDERDRGETDWIEQRRAERRRGAGTHGIEQRKISFGPRVTDASITTSSIASPNISSRRMEGQDDLDLADSTFNDDLRNDSRLDNAYENGFDFGDDQQDDLLLGGAMQRQSSGSIAAMRAMEKRKRKRQASPPRKGRLKSKSKKDVPRVNIDAINEEGDETVMAQADLTLQEQRETAFISSAPPAWTFPKIPITNEDLANIKEQVHEMVTLALGNEAGANRNAKVNDADVLYSIIRKEISRERHSQSSSSQIIKEFLDELLDSVLDTFTHLSRQSAERSQLIAHLVTARRKNLQLRKEVFKKRSQVLNVTRSMQALKEQEIKRVQREEDEEKSLLFLKRLQHHAHEWN